MKRSYQLFQRGGVYRIARPGRLFWHWEKEYDSVGDAIIVQSRLKSEIERKLKELQLLEERAYLYKKDRWHKVEVL